MPLRQLHSLATDMGHVELILPRSPMCTQANALDQLDQLLSGAAQPEHGLPEESLDRLCNHVSTGHMPRRRPASRQPAS